MPTTKIQIWLSEKSQVNWVNFIKFVQRMANRIAVGQLRYGKADASKKYLTRLKLELKEYSRTGNAEHLFNIANYCYLESIAPEHKKPHFDPYKGSATRDKI